jgi:TP901 family phage tail tape measure protein
VATERIRVDVDLGVEGAVGDATRLGKAIAKVDSQVKKLGMTKSIKPLGEGLSAATANASEFEKSMAAANARVIAFGASAGLIFQVTRALRETVKATIDVEASLADINVVLGASQQGIKDFGQSLFKIASQTGQSFKVVAQGATELVRQGLSVVESQNRLKDALILTRLTGMNAEDAVASLTAAVNSFNKVGATSAEVVNKMAKVDQNFAVSSEDLSNALRRVGSSAVDAGVSMDELFGMVTAVQQRTARGGAVIGNSFKTIFTRIQRTDVQNKLAEINVQTQAMDGSMRSATAVLSDLAARFQTLSDAQQAQIAESVAGVFQINQLRALLGDLADKQGIAARATRDSATAADEAYKKNEQLNKTLLAQINATQQLATAAAATIGADVFGPSIRVLTEGVQGIINFFEENSIAKKIGSAITSGLGDFLKGPGLAVAGVVIGKLAINMVKFGIEAKNSFFAIGAAAKGFNSTVNTITAEIMKQPQLLERVRNGELSVKAASDLVSKELTEQNALLATQAGLARQIATNMALGMGGTKGIKRQHGGKVPNFSPLGDAVAREQKAGVPNYAIRVGSHPSLRSGGNPGGLGVYNTIHEPGGISQGIQRYRSQGLNPRTAGMGIPNFVKKDDPLSNALALLLADEKLLGTHLEELVGKKGIIRHSAVAGASGFTGGSFTGHMGVASPSRPAGVPSGVASMRAVKAEMTAARASKATLDAAKDLKESSKNLDSTVKQSKGGLASRLGGLGGLGTALALPMVASGTGMAQGQMGQSLMNSTMMAMMVHSLFPKSIGKAFSPFGGAFGKGGAGRAGFAKGPVAPPSMHKPVGMGVAMTPAAKGVSGVSKTFGQRFMAGGGAALRGLVGLDPSGSAKGLTKMGAAKAIGGKIAIHAGIALAINDFYQAFKLSELEKANEALKKAQEGDIRTQLGNAQSAVGMFASGFGTSTPKARKESLKNLRGQIFGEEIKGKLSEEEFKGISEEYNNFVKSFAGGEEAVAEAAVKLNNSLQLVAQSFQQLDGEARRIAERKFIQDTDAIIAGGFTKNKREAVSTFTPRPYQTGSMPYFSPVRYKNTTVTDRDQVDRLTAALTEGFEFGGLEAGLGARDKGLIGPADPRMRSERGAGLRDRFKSDVARMREAISKGKTVSGVGSKGMIDALTQFSGGKSSKATLRVGQLMSALNRQDEDGTFSANLGSRMAMLNDFEKAMVEGMDTAIDAEKAAEGKVTPKKSREARVGVFGTVASDAALRGRKASLDETEAARRTLFALTEKEIEIQNQINIAKEKHTLGLYGDTEMKRIAAVAKAARAYEDEAASIRKNIEDSQIDTDLKLSKAERDLAAGSTKSQAKKLLDMAFDARGKGGRDFLAGLTPGNVELRRSQIDKLAGQLADEGKDQGTLTATEKKIVEFRLAQLRAVEEGTTVETNLNSSLTTLGTVRDKQINIANQEAEAAKALKDAEYKIARTYELRDRQLKAEMARARAGFTLDDFSRNRMTGDQLRSDAAAARAAGRLSGGLEEAPFAGLGQLTREAFAYNTLDATNEFERGITDVAVTVRDSMKDAIKNIASGAESFEDGMFRIFAALADKIADQGISMGVNSIFGAFGAKRHGGKVARGYNSGGVVTGGSGVRDDVPAMMQGGEYVIKKSSAQKIGYGALNAINSYANGGKARVSLAKEFLFTGDDPKRPTGGKYNVSRNLSTAALFRDDDPQTDLMFGRQEKLVNYLEYRRKEQERRDKILDDIKRQKRGRLMNAYMSAGLRIGAGFIGQNFGPTAMAGRAVTAGTDAAISGDVPIGSPLGVGADSSMPAARGGSPALLMGGEYVMSSRTVNKYGTGFMAQLNSGRMPGYNQGGLVGGGGAAAGITTNNVNLAINIDKTGNAQVQTQEQDANTNGQDSESQEVENSKKFADAIRAAVQKEITKQQRPGGLLRDGATYAGGRRI